MAVKTSTTTGNFDADATWVGGAKPVLGTDTVVVAALTTVIYNLSSTTQQLDFTVNGTLQFASDMDTKMVLGNASITIANGGRLRIGTAVSPLDKTRVAELLFNPSADNSKGLVIQAGGILEIYGDPTLYGSDYDAVLAANWSPSASAKMFTIVGDFTTKWAAGQELLIHKNPAVYGNYNTDFAPSGVGPATIASVAANGSNTDITINEGTYTGTYRAGGLVLNLTRNIKLGKYGAATLIGQAALTNRPLLTDANTTAGNVNISNAILTGFYRPGGSGASPLAFNNVQRAVFRHCDIALYQIYHPTSIDVIAYGNAAGAFSGITQAAISGYVCNNATGFAGNGNSNTRNTVTSTIYGNSTGIACLSQSTYIGSMFCNAVAITGYVSDNNIYGYNYGNAVGITTCVDNNFYSAFGWDENGNLRINTVDIQFANTYTSKSIFKNTKLPPPLAYGNRNNIRGYDGRFFFENYNQTIGDHRIIDAYGDLIKNTTTVRTGGAASTIEVIPQSNCSIPLPLQILDWKESEVPATSQTRSVFIRGGGSSGWVTFPTAAQLWLEAEYLDSASAWTTAVIKSTAVLTDNTTWVEFPLTFTPGRQGVVRYRAYLATYAANAEVFVDNQLQRLNDSTLLGVWADGASNLQEQTDMFTDADRTKLDTVISTMALDSTVAKELTLTAGVESILAATPTVDFTEVMDELALIKAKTNLITTGRFTVKSPLSATGKTLDLNIGDDYDAAHDTEIEFSSADFPDLTVTGTVPVLVVTVGSTKLTVDGTVASSNVARFELTKAQTLTLPKGKGAFTVRLRFADLDEVTKLSGVVNTNKVT